MLPIEDGVRINLPDERKDVPLPVRTRARAVERAQREQSAQDHCQSVEQASDSDESSLSDYFIVEQRRSLKPMFTTELTKENVKVSNSHARDPNQREVLRETPECEVENSYLPTPERIEDQELEGGEGQCINVPLEAQADRVELRPKREVRPVKKLSYDELGKSSDRSLTLVYSGMIVQIENSQRVKQVCKIWLSNGPVFSMF